MLHDLANPEHVWAAAIIATSSNLTKAQLDAELDDIAEVQSTVASTQTVITKFEQEGLIELVKIKEGSSAAVNIIKHTPKFDRCMDQIQLWQQTMKLRVLAHKLGKSPSEAADALMVFGSLLLG